MLSAIDELNAQDPRQHEHAGRAWPYELLYSQWVTEWVHKLRAEPSEELQIAARGQHVQRWTSPRSSYPEVRGAARAARPGRPGWRARSRARRRPLQGRAVQPAPRPAASSAPPPV